MFDKTDRDAQEIAEHINETCGLMWYDLFLVELGLGKHMTNLRPVGSHKLHKLWSNKISKIHQMTLQDGMEGLRLALQVLCGPHNFGALGTDPPDPLDRSTYPRDLRRGYYARLGDPAGHWQSENRCGKLLVGCLSTGE